MISSLAKRKEMNFGAYSARLSEIILNIIIHYDQGATLKSQKESATTFTAAYIRD